MTVMFGLTSVVVMLLVGLMLIAGALLLRSSTPRGAGDACPNCGHSNPPEAHFCARCGCSIYGD